MRELYIEDLANHGGPESCVGVREGVGEALTGVRVVGAIEPRKVSSGCRRRTTGRKARSSVTLSRGGRWTLRGLRTQECVESPCVRTGRPDGRPSAVDDAPSWMARGVVDRRLGGPRGESEGRSPR
jgi:hypothetical protein